METKSVPISAIQITFQIRKDGNDEQQIQKIMRSIEDEGWKPSQHLDVIQPTPGVESYTLADGNHRLEALRRLGFEEAPVRIVGTSTLEMQKCAYRNNTNHGKELPPKDRKAFLLERIKEYCGPVHRKSSNWLADEFDVDPKTVKKYRGELERDGFIFPEMVIGKDGKERPAENKNNSTMGNPIVQEHDTPCHFCAGGCGTPIWEEMKDAPDSTYFHIQKNGMNLWFCSEECYRHSWHCPPDEKECEDVEDDEAPVYVKCEHCGKTTTLQEAKDYRKSGWQPVDRDFNRWYCSEECLNAALGDETKPEPHPEPPAREPAPSSCQASGAEPEQEEEPDEFTFTDVDEETLPVCTEKPKEVPSYIIPSQVYIQVNGASSLEEALEMIKASFPLQDGNFTVKFGGIYENINNNLNNNININTETFTEFCVICKGKRKPVKFYISRSKYNEWKTEFSKKIDLDETLTECCKYYSNLEGAERLKPEEVYARLYLCLLKNAKQQRSGSNQNKKISRYRTAGESYDDLIY